MHLWRRVGENNQASDGKEVTWSGGAKCGGAGCDARGVRLPVRLRLALGHASSGGGSCVRCGVRGAPAGIQEYSGPTSVLDSCMPRGYEDTT